MAAKLFEVNTGKPSTTMITRLVEAKSAIAAERFVARDMVKATPCSSRRAFELYTQGVEIETAGEKDAQESAGAA